MLISCSPYLHFTAAAPPNKDRRARWNQYFSSQGSASSRKITNTISDTGPLTRSPTPLNQRQIQVPHQTNRGQGQTPGSLNTDISFRRPAVLSTPVQLHRTTFIQSSDSSSNVRVLSARVGFYRPRASTPPPNEMSKRSDETQAA